MADRTVKVDTILGSGAKEGLEALGFKVEEVDNKVERLNRDLKQTADDVAKAAATMELLKAATAGAGGGVDSLGQKHTVMKQLDDAIVETQGKVRNLSEEFNRTGNVDVFKGLTDSKNALKDLEKMRTDLTSAMKTGMEDVGKEAGTEASKGFASTFTSSIAGFLGTPVLGPIILGVVLAAIVAALPAINGAFLALAGMGGLATGIIGQLSDPDIHSAFVTLGKDLEGVLKSDTASFKEPLLRAIGEIGGALRDALGTIDFGNLAKSLEPVVLAVISLISNIMPGFNKFLDASGPILASLVTDFQIVGTAISTMFDLMSRGGTGAAEGLRFLLAFLGGILIAIGGIVLALSKMMEWAVAAGTAISDFFERGAENVGLTKLATALETIGDLFRKLNPANDETATWVDPVKNLGAAAVLTADDLAKLNTQLGQTKVTTDTLEAAINQKLFTAIMNVDQGVLGWNKSLLTLHDTLNQSGRAIDKHTGLVAMNTKEGIANREAVLSAMQANMQEYQSFVAAGMGADEARGKYDANTKSLEDMLHKAGYTQKQIDDMIGSLKNVPDMTHADIVANGLQNAIDQLDNLLAQLNGLNGRAFGFSVTAAVYDPGSSTRARMAAGGIYEHADVGLLNAQIYAPASGGPARYAFAEPSTGGEAFVPRLGDYGRSTGILDQAAQWYGGRFMAGNGAGGSGVIFNLTVNAGMGTDGAALGQQVASVLRPYINSFGGNVQAALGRRGQ